MTVLRLLREACRTKFRQPGITSDTIGRGFRYRSAWTRHLNLSMGAFVPHGTSRPSVRAGECNVRSAELEKHSSSIWLARARVALHLPKAAMSRFAFRSTSTEALDTSLSSIQQQQLERPCESREVDPSEGSLFLRLRESGGLAILKKSQMSAALAER
jgi:hypothetical protein